MGFFQRFCGRAPRPATPKAVPRRTGAIALSLTLARRACGVPDAAARRRRRRRRRCARSMFRRRRRRHRRRPCRRRAWSSRTTTACATPRARWCRRASRCCCRSRARTRRCATSPTRCRRRPSLRVFDSGSRDILLMPRDDGGTPERAAEAAAKAIDDGAEIIIGPLFAQSVTVGCARRARGQGAGRRLLDRPFRRRARRLSLELPAGERSAPHRQLRGPEGPQPCSARWCRGRPMATWSARRSATAVTDAGANRHDAADLRAAARSRRRAGARGRAVAAQRGPDRRRRPGPASDRLGAGRRRRRQPDGAVPRHRVCGTTPPCSASRCSPTAGSRRPIPKRSAASRDHYRMAFNAAPPRIATLGYDAMSLVALAGARAAV